jgi:hypothetical protein
MSPSARLAARIKAGVGDRMVVVEGDGDLVRAVG